MLGTDGSIPIENNRQALKHVLGTLAGMVELGSRGQFTLFRQEGAVASRQAQAEKSELSPAPSPAFTLPRRLYRAVLSLLQPAESAARRLIIAAARGIVVVLPPPRKPKPPPPARGPRAFIPVNPKRRRKRGPRIVTSLSLLDPLKRPFRVRRHYVPAHAAPRIRSLGFESPFQPRPPPWPKPPSPDDPMNAARIGQRLAALAAALDDLPGQARRFARWQARNNAALERNRQTYAAAKAEGRRGAVTLPFRRFSPLRVGRPPGGRLWRYDPDARRKKRTRDIDAILAHCHSLAQYALAERRTDTS